MRSLNNVPPPDCLVALAPPVKPAGEWLKTRSERRCKRKILVNLLNNQNNLCGYCEKGINSNTSHCEHIQPKGNSLYNHLARVMPNLIACCGKDSGVTCGHKKQGKVLPSWVHPYHTPSLQDSFIYEDDGEIAPSPTLGATKTREAKLAIGATLLNLNERLLKEKREEQYSDFLDEQYKDMTLADLMKIFKEYPSLTEQHINLNRNIS